MGLLAKVQRAVRHVAKKDRHSRESEEGKSKDKNSSSAKKKKSQQEKMMKTEKDTPTSATDDAKPSGKSKTQVAATSSTEVAGSVRSASTKPSVTPATVDGFFNRYRDALEDAILAEGMETLCTDMDVDPTDVRMLALAWKFGAVTMCRFNRGQFVDGCLRLVVDSAAALRDALPSLVEESRRSFRDFYKFTFEFGLDSGERCLSREMAIALWRLVSPVSNGDMSKFTDRWCVFLEKGRVRGVTRDCWNVFLEFCHVVDKDFANYSDEDAWPSLIDEFVEDQLRSGLDGDGAHRQEEADE